MKKLFIWLTALLMSAAWMLTYAHSSTDLSAEVVTRGHNNGITKYDTVAAFNANAYVTREQAAKMISTWIGTRPELGLSMPAEIDCTFNDQTSIDETLRFGVENACNYGLFRGYQGNFMPKNLLNHEDARTLLMRLIDKLPKYESYRDDVPSAHMGFVTRGQLLKALFHINAIVEVQIEDDKDADLAAAQAKLNAAIVLWNSKGINNYTVRQQLSCFCTVNSTHPISFDVENDLVVSGSLHDVNDEDKLPASELTAEPKTVEQMFNLIQEAIDRRADSISITYDATLGYATHINLDYSTMMADEEVYYTYLIETVE